MWPFANVDCHCHPHSQLCSTLSQSSVLPQGRAEVQGIFPESRSRLKGPILPDKGDSG